MARLNSRLAARGSAQLDSRLEACAQLGLTWLVTRLSPRLDSARGLTQSSTRDSTRLGFAARIGLRSRLAARFAGQIERGWLGLGQLEVGATTSDESSDA